MLLAITNTNSPATDLGYLLHKSPDRTQSFELPFGNAHVFYSERSADRCTAVLMLDVDAVGLVRNNSGRSQDSPISQQYVNDRPYVSSSFLSVAISRIYGSALGGRSRERADLTQVALPLKATLAAVPCRGGEGVLRKLFEPLGYTVTAERHALDTNFPEWGQSAYFTVSIEGRCRLQELLSHLYVLIPVLDDDKHYWVGDDEVKKLLRHGGDWLTQHPERELIVSRYLRHRRHLTNDAMLRLLEEDNRDPDSEEQAHLQEEEAVEERVGLHEQRIGAVLAAVRNSGASTVLDLGCGEGRLLRALLEDKTLKQITGMDVSHHALEVASERLHLDRRPAAIRAKIQLLQGSLTYRDKRLSGYDAAVAMEVIEHLEPTRLATFERVLFEFAQPKTVIVTTPNSEYNVKFENLPAGKLRHRDHRFEWTRSEFQVWTDKVASKFSYIVRILPIGPESPDCGSPTQMAVFTSG